ncbi:MAG: hypothetical protein M3237_22650 [Actinomycetota bacterium]|nr:hypothetical protein [Actinomycetota bacterium]
MARSLSGARPLLAVLALALTLTVAPATTASADPDPLAPRTTSAKHPDTPVLPRECATVEELIPQRPMKCYLNPKIRGAPTIVLMGDSHAWQMIPAIRRAIGDRRVNFVGFIFGACPPMDPALRTAEEVRNANNCEKTSHKAIRYLTHASQQHRRVRVVVGAAWAIYHHVQTYGDDVPFSGHNINGYERVSELARTGIPRLFRTLTRLGIPADAVGQSPFVPARPKRCAAGMEPYRCGLRRSVAVVDESFHRAQVKYWMRRVPGNPKITTQSNHMCTAKVCHGTVDGVNTYYDHGHIGARMSKRLAPYFGPTVDKLLKGVR